MIGYGSVVNAAKVQPGSSVVVPGGGGVGLNIIQAARIAGVAVQESGIEEETTINMRLFEWDQVYINPRHGMCRPGVDVPHILRLYAQGALKLEELVTRRYAFDDAPQAIDDMLLGVNAKGALVMT